MTTFAEALAMTPDTQYTDKEFALDSILHKQFLEHVSRWDDGLINCMELLSLLTMETIKPISTNDPAGITMIENRIIKMLNEHRFVNGASLVTEITEQACKNGYAHLDIVSIINDMVKQGKIQKIEYTVIGMEYRIKSLYASNDVTLVGSDTDKQEERNL